MHEFSPLGKNDVGAFRQRACLIPQKAVRWHPDKNPDKKEYAQKRMQRINEAYETLSDIEKRKMYDLGGGMSCTVSSYARYSALLEKKAISCSSSLLLTRFSM
jgi:preprotein translocase subunit Sec63